MILAVRTFWLAIASGEGCSFPVSGSFHMWNSVTRPLKCVASARTHASHAAHWASVHLWNCLPLP